MPDPLGLLPSLKRWGVLRSQPVEEALAEVDWRRMEPSTPGQRGALFAPVRRPDGSFELSPRLAVLLAELLELGPGLRVALPFPRPVLLDALVRALGAKVFDPARDKAADRSVEVVPLATAAPLNDGGFVLRASLEPFQESLTKIVHASGGAVDLGLEKLPLIPGDDPPRPIRQLLVVEGFCRRLLDRRPRTPQDELFNDAIEQIWDPAAARDARGSPGPERLASARPWFGVAYVHQFSADLGDASELYRASIDAHPTSEAHTFLGWTLSMMGDLRGAILECEKAIQADASLGNPFNDIGAYHLELHEARAALPWFDRALQAPRYRAPHFAHTNKGRALVQLRRYDEARGAFQRALSLEPNYRPAQEGLRRIEGV